MKLPVAIVLLSFNVMICCQVNEIEQAINDGNVEQVERLLQENPLPEDVKAGFLDLADKWTKDYNQLNISRFRGRGPWWPIAAIIGGGCAMILSPAMIDNARLTKAEIIAATALFVGGAASLVVGLIKDHRNMRKEITAIYTDALKIKQLIYRAKTIS